MKSLNTISLAGTILLIGFCTANAAHIITFDEFPLGTLIDNEYAGFGVLFLPGDLTPRLPQISDNIAMPDQPVLRATGEPDNYLFQGDFWMEFIIPVYGVQFDSGYWDAAGVGIIKVYDPDMNLLANLTNPGTGVQTINITGMGQIGYIYFNSIDDEAGADIDNLIIQDVVAVVKEIDDWIDLGDEDGYLEVGEMWGFLLKVTVFNNSDSELLDAVVVKDRLGGELMLGDEDEWWDTAGGNFSFYTQGNSEKVFITWDGFSVAPGESETLWFAVYTDTNPGTGNGKKPGKQEYTSPGVYDLNSGANVKGMLGCVHQVSDSSDPITVEVLEPGDYDDN